MVIERENSRIANEIIQLVEKRAETDMKQLSFRTNGFYWMIVFSMLLLFVLREDVRLISNGTLQSLFTMYTLVFAVGVFVTFVVYWNVTERLQASRVIYHDTLQAHYLELKYFSRLRVQTPHALTTLLISFMTGAYLQSYEFDRRALFMNQFTTIRRLEYTTRLLHALALALLILQFVSTLMAMLL